MEKACVWSRKQGVDEREGQEKSEEKEENLGEKTKSGITIKEKKEGNQGMEKGQLRLKKLNISWLTDKNREEGKILLLMGDQKQNQT